MLQGLFRLENEKLVKFHLTTARHVAEHANVPQVLTFIGYKTTWGILKTDEHGVETGEEFHFCGQANDAYLHVEYRICVPGFAYNFSDRKFGYYGPGKAPRTLLPWRFHNCSWTFTRVAIEHVNAVPCCVALLKKLPLTRDVRYLIARALFETRFDLEGWNKEC